MSKLRSDETIYTSKPNKEGRLDKEMKVYNLLEKLDIPYYRLDHEAVMTVDSGREVEKILGIKVCKNLFLCNPQKTKFYMLMMRGDKKFKSGIVSRQIESARLSFAPEEYMEKFLNITPGSVSILGLMNDINNNVQLLMDKEIVKEKYIGCHPCVNTSSLKVKTTDVLGKFIPYVKHEIIYVDI